MRPASPALSGPRSEGASATAALDALHHAGSIVIVGASSDDTKLSGLALRNLRRCGFDGRIHAVNRRGAVIDGVTTHTSIRAVAEIDDAVDAAIVMVPADDCAEAVTELGAIGVRVAVVAVSGFAELGTDEGRRRQDELVAAAHAAGVRLIGPNGNGVYATHRPLSLGYNHLHGLQLTAGNVALLSHSGAIAGTALELIEGFGAGLSHFVSCGNEADLTLLDHAEYLLDDPHATVFALVLDRVDDGPRFRRFARRARQAGRTVLVLKLGDSEVGRRATLAHSSRLSGPRAVYEAVFEADGVVATPTLESLMISAGLAAQGRTSTRTGTVVASPSGGACILMADALDRAGVPLEPLDEATAQALAPTARFATVMNPLDLGASGAHNAAVNVPLLAATEGVGSLAYVVTILQTELGQRRYSEAFAEAAAEHPHLAVVVVAPAALRDHEAATFRSASIPVIASTTEAANVLATLRALAVARSLDAEEARVGAADPTPDATAADPGIAAVLTTLRDGRTPDEAAAKRFLSHFGVTHPGERVVDFDEVAAFADDPAGLCYPLVVKALAEDLAHKAAHGLVVLDVADPAGLRHAAEQIRADLARTHPHTPARLLVAEQAGPGCEVIVGLVRDPEFGLLAVVGPGGAGVEAVGELHHLALPVTAGRLDDVLHRGVLGRLLDAGPDGPADREALAELITSLTAAAEVLAPHVDAIEVNPVRVGLGTDGGALALDALITPRTPTATTTPTTPPDPRTTR